MAFRKKVKLQMFVTVLNKPLSTMEHILPFKHQSHKMVRHAQTIRRLNKEHYCYKIHKSFMESSAPAIYIDNL